MISSWRRRREARRAGKKQGLEENTDGLELIIPAHFKCPISLDLMKDPVTLSTGITYDRDSIESWIEGGNATCPITNQVLTGPLEPIPNHTIRRMIQNWCLENHASGVERIPTPRIPITSYEVSEILSRLETTHQSLDQEGTRQLAVKIKNLAKESERNKRCIVKNGTSSVLAAAFDTFSKNSSGVEAVALEEILSALAIMLPLDEEAKASLGSTHSLYAMVSFLKGGALSTRRNAALVIKGIIVSSSNKTTIEALVGIEGAQEALVALIKEPICPTTTKASLMTIYHIVSSSANDHDQKKATARFVDMGMVSLLLEMLVDSEKSICEKVLGVLDGLCDSDEGIKKAYDHALTMPILVKKVLRVSDLATEFSVSILWKLGKNEKREDGGVLVEALHVGAFQKLLLLLQVGCEEKTKEKASELLKMLNHHRERLLEYCVDSMDFKHLKRPF